MKIFFLLFIYILSNSSFCQNSTLQIYDDINGQNIESVLVYHNGKLISISDGKGFVKITIKKGEIELVKEGYYDAKFNLETILDNKVYLKKILSIQLKEVLVKNSNKQNILDSIYSKIWNKKLYSYPEHYHNFNVLSSDKDTLHYLNERLQFDEKKGFYVNIQNKFIKKFVCEEVKKPKNTFQLVYGLKDKKLAFPKTLNLGYIRIDYYQEFTNLYREMNDYEWKLTNSDDYSKITFYPNNKNKKFMYKGYIIFNDNDYGIIEFKMELINNNKNIILSQILNQKSKFEYLIQNEIFHIIYKQNEGRYYFMSSINNLELIQLKGNFKKQIFSKKSYFEETSPFDLTNKKKLDIYTFNLL